MIRRAFLTGLAACAVLTACTPQSIPSSARTTVILVRHADRAGDILSMQGLARAANLPQALVGYELDAIYSPDIARNVQTAEPLSEALDLPVTIIAKERAGAKMSRAHPNGTVIWIGNKGNLRAIWAELGGTGEAPQAYGEIGVITLQSMGRREVKRLEVTP
ncbi:histidine phosphatase family protein [uncultured Roseobacter sp.]|uniref:histidine phosphatase family protein n=1 Tax=uncultured Roseobacter sp. TaxID=114847 RepID=UPI0026050789|nr:histidine phosphatase family protein [uncultured Roseobacter sp.]